MSGLLILSIFPGIDLLGRAFEQEWPEACIVRGPDVLWGGDIRGFHPPAGRFDGVIGGPPCQIFSALAHLVHASGHETRFGNLIPEFERVVFEAQPSWFIMENVRASPTPVVEGYGTYEQLLNSRWLGEEQNRLRRISFGTTDGRRLDIELSCLEAPMFSPAVLGAGDSGISYEERRRVKTKRGFTSLAGHGPVGRGNGYDVNPTIAEACRLQGLPENFTEYMPFTAHGKRSVVGNGVPLPMGRAIAKAVRRALDGEQERSE